VDLIGQIGEKASAQEAKAASTPPWNRVFAALTTPLPAIRVVIIGQDPYPGPGMATGRAFEVPAGSTLPPTLRNIAIEYAADVGRSFEVSVMDSWAKQGVLLLNRVLTTSVGESLAHQSWGWQRITDAVLQAVAGIRPSAVAVLWGRKALEVRDFFAAECRVESPHPSPLSARRGFFGSRPFSRVNAILGSQGAAPIQW
jgi:uracil-DNA glycosylase